MTREEILQTFSDINHAYNNSTKYDTLKRMLDELTEPCEEHQREFIELVVEYPNPDLCTYPEYRGKPYFSIKYRENGKYIVGYGSYKIEMISQWIKEYFMPSIQPKPKMGHWEQYGYSWEDKFKCSECGKEQPKILCGERIIGHWSDYCPNCGADMRESEDA